MKIRQIITIAVWMGFFLTTSAITEWSLYETDPEGQGEWCYEYLYGNTYINEFQIPDGYKRHLAGDDQSLWFTDVWYPSEDECGIVETTLEGDIVNEFTVYVTNTGMIGCDGEYLWLANDYENIYCFNKDGTDGPYPPIIIPYTHIWAIEGWEERICVIVTNWKYREYSRTGALLNEFQLPPPPDTGYGTYNALAVEPGADGLIWTFCWDGLDGWGYLRKFTHDGTMVSEELWGIVLDEFTIAKSTVQQNIQSTSLGRIKSLFAE